MNKKGIALIMAVGVLALLAIIATSFALNMRLEYHTAVNYANGVKARYLADAALKWTIAELRSHAKSSAFDDRNEPWASLAGYSTTSATGFTVTSQTTAIQDEQRKINVNMDGATCQLLLSNLVEILRTYDGVTCLDGSEAGNIAGNRPSNTPSLGYKKLRELCTVNKETASGTPISKEALISLSRYITVNSYRDPNCSNRAPINVNTADQEVIAAVIMGIANDGSGGLPAAGPIDRDTAWFIAGNIVSRGLFSSWKGFDDVIDSLGIDTDYATLIKYNCNPNRLLKPTIPTTEFCFNSGGFYSIQAEGIIRDSLGITVADRSVNAIAKIYDIYNETTKAQFELGTADKTTWLDTCPVISGDLFGNWPDVPSDAKTIPGSIKLGFWDDFNDYNESYKQWKRDWGDMQPGDLSNDKLVNLPGSRWDVYGPPYGSGWNYTFGDFALRVSAHESGSTSGSPQMKDVAWVLFRNDGSSIYFQYLPAAMHTRPGTLCWENVDPERYAYPDRWSGWPPQIVFLTCLDVCSFSWDTGGSKGRPRGGSQGRYTDMYNSWDQWEAEQYRYYYPDGWPGSWPDGEIRIFTMYDPGGVPEEGGWPEDENMDTDTYRTLIPYRDTKTFNIVTKADGFDSHIVRVSVLTQEDPGNPDFTRYLNDCPWNSELGKVGRIVLYGNNVYVEWDDIRVIPAEDTTYPPNFTSQPIDSSKINGLSEGVEWGTVTGTLTLPPGESWDWSSDQFKWRFSTSVDGTNWDMASPDGLSAGDYFIVDCTSGNVNSGSMAASITFDDGPTYTGDRTVSIQYRVDLQTTNMLKTPVLEDVTLTYLPKVRIESYSLSAQ